MNFSLHPFRSSPWAAVALMGLASSVSAQLATYRSTGTPCPNSRGVVAQMTSTLPIPGRALSVSVTGQRSAVGFLTFSSRFYTGRDLSFLGMPGCRLYCEPALGVTMPIAFPSTSARTTQRIYVPPGTPKTNYFSQAFVVVPGANALGVVASDGGIGRVGIEPDLTWSQIVAFAPVIRIHPEERYKPMDPMEFIRVSRFRHSRNNRIDQSYHRTERVWKTTTSKNSVYKNIPVSYINSFRHHANGQNRRPGDANAGSTWNVYLAADGALPGNQSPNREVPIFTYYKRRGDYTHEIQYWYFTPYNDSLLVGRQGDWDHVTVVVRSNTVVGAYYGVYDKAHEYHSRSNMIFVGTHPVVYMSKGFHQGYPKPGTWGNGLAKCADGGYQWLTYLNVQKVADQPWRDFAGAWGDEDELIQPIYGPLGPWHRRHLR